MQWLLLITRTQFRFSFQLNACTAMRCCEYEYNFNQIWWKTDNCVFDSMKSIEMSIYIFIQILFSELSVIVPVFHHCVIYLSTFIYLYRMVGTLKICYPFRIQTLFIYSCVWVWVHFVFLIFRCSRKYGIQEHSFNSLT